MLSLGHTAVPTRCCTARAVARAPTAAGGHVPRAVNGAGRRRAVIKAAQNKGTEGTGTDLSWSHVARDIRHRLSVVKNKQSMLDKLQRWLGETRLSCDLGSEPGEHSQAELVAEQEAQYQGLDTMLVDVKHWLSGAAGDEELDSKMAGVLVLRCLQAYQQGAGEPFDDESDDAFWRMQGFLPGELVEALDHATLQRMIKAYLAVPFSGV
ncbi:hypothetical protein D9Q98_003412 [Chlorella vulgaris]|uniref:Uncharacterized protein n=1 Tax=Chlorella vulgaris TaxID=3077 RepID=A0A9D4TSR5_CHLVU|nr:hypothetical protein D9Q98_003412 [Chlorella vulgaris]